MNPQKGNIKKIMKALCLFPTYYFACMAKISTRIEKLNTLQGTSNNHKSPMLYIKCIN